MPQLRPRRLIVTTVVRRRPDRRASAAPRAARPRPAGRARRPLGARRPDGRAHYAERHLPAAVYVDLETELAARAVARRVATRCRSSPTLQAAARRWGLRQGRPVVVYDDIGGLSAARAWWLLRWAGVADVRILDGALGAWTGAGLPVESGESPAGPGDVDLWRGPPAGARRRRAAGARPDDGVLLDARAGERYRGEVEPVDPAPGTSPARSAPDRRQPRRRRARSWTPTTLRARSRRRRRREPTVGVYCGSGVTAAHEIAALAVAGIDAALYPGLVVGLVERSRTARSPPARPETSRMRTLRSSTGADRHGRLSSSAPPTSPPTTEASGPGSAGFDLDFTRRFVHALDDGGFDYTLVRLRLAVAGLAPARPVRRQQQRAGQADDRPPARASCSRPRSPRRSPPSTRSAAAASGSTSSPAAATPSSAARATT